MAPYGGDVLTAEEVNRCTGSVVDAAYRVHLALGPGLLESAYTACLAHELASRGHRLEVQRAIPLVYRDLRIRVGYRADIVVDGEVVVEVKAVERILPVHRAQVLTYLKLTGCRVGLLVNFHTPRLKDGIKRIVNSMEDQDRAPDGRLRLPRLDR